MARPRQVLPGRTYLLTRRCSERRFLLRPGGKTNQAIAYCLFEAAIRFDVDVHAYVAMSNHAHWLVHDRYGNYPQFLAHLHKMTAKVLNCHWGRFEALWASEQTSVVWLVEAADIFAKLIYVLCNPVAAHLVDRAHLWPGASSLPAMLTGKEVVVRRPHWFFDREGTMPEQVRYRFKRPRAFARLSQAQWADKLRTAIAEQEAKAAAKRQQDRTRILGRKGILAQSAFDAPATHAPRRDMSPRVAAHSKWSRIEALQRNERFLEDYRAALEVYRQGNTDAVFPAGTHLLYEDGHVYRDVA